MEVSLYKLLNEPVCEALLCIQDAALCPLFQNEVQKLNF